MSRLGAVEPSGKLELTWTNKHLRLLSGEDCGYTWVPPSDYRVAEVRLLHEVEPVGEIHSDRERARDNLHVTAKTGTTWSYLLAGETAIAEARGSWAALEGLAG